MRQRLAIKLALIASAGAVALSCRGSAPSSSSPEHPPARGRSSGGRDNASPRGPGPILGEYDVLYDGKSDVRVEARLDPKGASREAGAFSIEGGVEGFVKDFQFAPAPRAREAPAWQSGAADRNKVFVAPPCAAGPCVVRYRVALRAAAKRIEDLDVASEEGAVLEAPPSSWLLAPREVDPNARIRFRVRTAEGSNTSFVTGVFRAEGASDVWDVAIGDLWTAPYSAFGPLRVKTLTLAENVRVDMAIAPGPMLVTDEQLATFTTNAARAITTYYGLFPLPELLVMFVPGRGRWVGEGKTLSGGGGAIFMRIGEVAPLSALKEDWVLVHEMTHLTFPSVAREHDWAEEGLATYVEPFARARAGLLSTEAVWESLVEGMPNGLPKEGDRGLDQTPTWGRTYWGGALFYLLSDIEIRKRTQNRLGLEHALRAILSAGGNNAHRWQLDDAFDVGDKATGVPVLRELHAAMGTSPHPVDLDALWKSLGVVRGRGGVVRFDEGAPLAAIRRAMTAP